MLAVGAAKSWMNGLAPVERLRLREAPMLLAAFAFAAGVVSAKQFHPPATLLACTALALLTTLVALRWARRWSMASGLVFLAAIGCWCAQIQPPVSRPVDAYRFADGLSRNVRGHVMRLRTLPATSVAAAPEEAAAPWLAEPGAWEPIEGAAEESVDLRIDAIEEVTPDTSLMHPVAAGVRITLRGDSPLLHCGDAVEVPLRLRIPETLRNPGTFSIQDWLATQGVDLTAVAKGDTLRLTGGRQRELRCRMEAAQDRSAARVRAFSSSGANQTLPRALRIDTDDAAMLAAMLFGDRAGLTHERKESFERTGSFHLFVVSGLHVTLLAGGLLWMLRRLRWREEAAIPAALALSVLYALFTGMGEPVQRALLMTAAFLLARLFGRRSSAMQALGVAAFLALAVDPRALYEASFQMTTLVIFAITGLASPLWQRSGAPYAHTLRSVDLPERDVFYPPRIAAFRVRVRLWMDLAEVRGAWPRSMLLWLLRGGFALAEAMLFSVIAECVMALPMAVYFHRLTLWSLPLTLFVLPVVGVLLGAAFVFFALLLLSPWAALPAAAATALALHILRQVVDALSHLSTADWRVPAPPAMTLLAAASLLLFAAAAVRERHRAFLLAGVCALFAAPWIALWPARPLLTPNRLEVTAIDVGQGDSLLAVSPDGRTMLVDAGGPTGGMASASGWDVGEDVIAPYLWLRRIRRLDAVLLTHAHSDHMGGMPAILRDFRPKELWLSIDPGNAPELRSLETLCATLGIAVRHLHAGDEATLGMASLRVLAPETTYSNNAEPVNNDSLVTELRWGKASALLEGDAESASETRMVGSGRVGPVTLLKVAHHGSRTSTTDALLAAAKPRMGVISVGRQNTFGHPRFEVLERLEQNHVQTFRTDRSGMVRFLLAQDGSITAEPVGVEDY